jgi:hypothetical protein
LLSCHLRLGLPGGLFFLDFPTNTLYEPLLFPIRAACPTYLILLDLIKRIIFGEDFRPLSFTLTQVFSSAPYSQTPSAYVPPSNFSKSIFRSIKIQENGLGAVCSRYGRAEKCRPNFGHIRVI